MPPERLCVTSMSSGASGREDSQDRLQSPASGPRPYPNRVLIFRIPRMRYASSCPPRTPSAGPKPDLAKLLGMEWCPYVDAIAPAGMADRAPP
jgi:hypothetical protein